jgi:hypothetical protein
MAGTAEMKTIDPPVMRLRAFVAAGLLHALLLLPVGLALGAEPEPPRIFLDTTYTPPTGRTITVAACDDFQAALQAAQPGDVITLEAGARFTGNFTLPSKTGTGWIVIRTSAPDSSLPSAGTRITPFHTDVLPKIVSPNSEPAITAAPGAHHYRFLGVEVTVAPDIPINYNLILLGNRPATPADVPHDLIFDRVYIHGIPHVDLRRGIALNSASTAIIDSYIADVHELLSDSQAIAGWDGPGPYKIVNNYLEGAGENLMFGGADPSLTDLVPSDIEIRGNHFFKPLSWRVEDPSYAGRPWSVKNLLELKNARRVLIEGNLFEHNWAHGQAGTAIVLTVRNQDGTAPWSVVEDVIFTNNIVRHAASGIAMHGRDDLFPSQPTKRILIRNNLFDDVGGARWGGSGQLFRVLNGTDDLVIEHNTGFQDGSVLFAGGAPNMGFIYRNNIAPHNEFGVHGEGTAPGTSTLDTYFPGSIFARNILVGGNPAMYPTDNVHPASLNDVGFVDLAGGDYRLSPQSPYKNGGTDGQDIGADIDAITAALTGVAGSGGPELPRAVLDTSYVPPTGTTIAVPAGSDVQAALDLAQPGDVIMLEAGATYSGNFSLPAKPGPGWIIIRTSAPDSSLPPPGTRITPTDANLLPKIVSPNSYPALTAAPGAHHYRFIGLEFSVGPGVTLSHALVLLGHAETSFEQLPHDLILDRVYIHGTAGANVLRGLVLNSTSTAIVDSHVSEVHADGADSHAVTGWNGTGPFKIVNNYLEGAGANIAFGGLDPSVAQLVPSDIEIRGNHLVKPLTWKPGDPSYAGTPWTVKHLVELKNARRVLIDGNLFQHNWLDAGGGVAIGLAVRNQDGTAPWSVVEDVTITNNIVRHAGSGIGMNGRDAFFPSQPARRILIRNNLFDDVSGAQWGSSGRLFLAFNGIEDLVFEHNTGFQDGSVLYADGLPHTGFVYRDNIAPHNGYGVHGAGTAPGTRTLDTYFPASIFARNILAGGNPAMYPADNFFPASLNDVGFVDLAAGNYRLSAQSPYKNGGSDGRDVGVDVDVLESKTARARDGSTAPACGTTTVP